MTKSEMEEAVAEARHFIALYESGALKETTSGEIAAWRKTLQERLDWLDGYVKVPANLVGKSDLQIRSGLIRALEQVNENARLFTQMEAVRHFRTQKCMNHSPLRPIEQEWLNSLFAGLKIISGFRIFLEFDLRASEIPEQVGAHINQYGQYFRCRNCPDSYTRKKR